MIPDLTARHREPEWMDDPAADPAELDRALRFIRRVNKWFGYTRATLGHLDAFARRWRAGERVTVLDVGTGSADVPLAALDWARRRGHDVRVVGVDLHARTCEHARQIVAAVGRTAAEVPVLQGDALRLPFPDGAFDYAMTNMFLHHLSEAEGAAVLREMDRVSRRGIIVADLLRSRRAYFWISVFTATAGPMVRHDARVSVRQAYSRAEAEGLRDAAGLKYLAFHRHFGHRFVLAGEKG
ncbi:MAG TPA: methyltransferase domain-containing protein [Humisphaera sp.]